MGYYTFLSQFLFAMAAAVMSHEYLSGCLYDPIPTSNLLDERFYCGCCNFLYKPSHLLLKGRCLLA